MNRRKFIIRRFVALAIVILITILTFACCGAKKERTAYSRIDVYNVQASDTLWDIAKIYCPENMDKRKWIDEVEKLNNRTSSEIYAGETIKVYVYERK